MQRNEDGIGRLKKEMMNTYYKRLLRLCVLSTCRFDVSKATLTIRDVQGPEANMRADGITRESLSRFQTKLVYLKKKFH